MFRFGSFLEKAVNALLAYPLFAMVTDKNVISAASYQPPAYSQSVHSVLTSGTTVHLQLAYGQSPRFWHILQKTGNYQSKLVPYLYIIDEENTFILLQKCIFQMKVFHFY